MMRYGIGAGAMNYPAGGNAFLDALLSIQDDADPTKILQFQLSGLSTGTTRTITVPDANGTMALTSNLSAYLAKASLGTGVETALGVELGQTGALARLSDIPSSLAVGSITGLGTGVGTALAAAPNASGGVVLYGGSAGDLTASSLALSGNISATSWTTNGLRFRGVPGTLTDTTSSGTVAAAYTNKLGGNTIAATNVTTFSDYYSLFVAAPVAGTNATLTRKWSLGIDSLLIASTTANIPLISFNNAIALAVHVDTRSLSVWRTSHRFIFGNDGVGMNSGSQVGWGSDATTAGSPYHGTADLLLGRAGAASLQLGANHATTGTNQTIKAHNVTTGTGADLILKGGTGSVANGNVCFGTYSALAAETVQGYLTIKDEGGTPRKVAIVA